MKKNILASVACATMLLGVTAACSEETVLAGADAGYISLDLDFDPSPVKGPRGDRSRAAATDVTKSDLTLTLTHSSGALAPIVCSYDDFESKSRVNTGLYTLEAAYGDADAEGWDQAYFYGSTQLTVKNETVTPVSLPVRLANAIINVTLSDGFTSYMSDYTVTVTSGTGTVYDWAASNGRELYVKPGSAMVSVSFVKLNGKQATADLDPITVEARHRYNVTVDVDGGTAEMLKVSIDDSIDEKDVDIDISDANLPMLAAAPKILADGFEPGAVINTVEGSAYSGSLKSTIVARGVIANAVLNVNSAYLKSKGWPESIDLANPGTYQSLLDSYGVKTLGLTGNKAVFAVVDLTSLVSKILYVKDADNTSSFSLTVTDAQGKEETADLFSVNVEKLVLEILDGSAITDNGKATILVHYNGGDINDVKLYADNDRGTQTLLTVKSITPSAQFGVYTFEVESKDITTDENVTVHPKTVTVFGEAYELKVPNLRVVADQTNAFAKHAYVTLDFMTPELLAKQADVQFEVSTDGGITYTAVNTALESAARSSRVAGAGQAVYNISGLNPSATYTFRARLDSEKEVSTSAELTTEAATQLPNSDMEDWEIQAGGSKYWWKSYLGAADSTPWGTMNLITTSAGGSSTNMFNHNGCAYVARSGTDRSTDKRNGNYAADIKTIGWGYSDANGGMNAKNLTVGSLHLGNTPTSGEPTYGMVFNSRPSGIKFWYKYAPRNSADYGYVEIWVKDADGEIIAKSNSNINTQSEYFDMTLSLNYALTVGKANQICVIFRSSNNPECQTISDSNLTKPSFGNLSDGKYEGAILTIDDIELIYE